MPQTAVDSPFISITEVSSALYEERNAAPLCQKDTRKVWGSFSIDVNK